MKSELCSECGSLNAEIDRLEAEVAAWLDAFLEYGRHRLGCRYVPEGMWKTPAAACTCAFGKLEVEAGRLLAASRAVSQLPGDASG